MLVSTNEDTLRERVRGGGERITGRGTALPTVFTVAATLLTGCATIRGSQARETEPLLAAAGFEVQLVDAGDQPLEATPAYRLVSRTRNGAVEYVYADPENCRCVYVGGPKEYSEYRHLVERLAREQATEDPLPPCDGLCWPSATPVPRDISVNR